MSDARLIVFLLHQMDPLPDKACTAQSRVKTNAAYENQA